MKNIYLLVFAGLLANLCFAQESFRIDSLLNEMESADVRSKIEILIKLSDEYIFLDEDSALYYGNKAYELANSSSLKFEKAKAGFQLGKALYQIDSLKASLKYLLEAKTVIQNSTDSSMMFKVYNHLGYVYFDMEEFDNALEYQNLSLSIEKDITNKMEMASRLMDIGMVYEFTGNYEKALAYYNQALKVNRELGFEEDIAIALNNLGNVFQTWGNYEKALEYYLEALEIYERLEDQEGIAVINNNIGIVYHDWKQYDQALEYYVKGLEIEKMLENKRGIAQSLNNIAIIYDDKGNREQAYQYYNESLRMAEELNDKMSMAIALSNLGEFYAKEKQYTKALSYHFRSIELDEEMGNPIGVAQSYTSLGDLYFKIDNYTKSLEYYKKGLEILAQQNILPSMAESFKGLSEVYAKKGNYNQAYHYFKKYNEINDSIFSESMAKRLSMLQTGYEIVTREKEIELLNQEKEKKELQLELNQQKIKRQQIIGLGLIIAFAVFVVLSLSLLRQVNKRKKAYEKLVKQHKEIKKNREELIVAKNKAEESDKLKSAFLVNLSHEIRTPINGINGFSDLLKNNDVDEKDKEVYLDMIQTNTRQLILLIENILDVSSIETGQLTVGKERVNIVRIIHSTYDEYRQEQKLNNQEDIDFKLRINIPVKYEKILTDGKRIRQILDNLLSNAFKYTKKGTIDLICQIENNNLLISVRDTGIGIPKEKQEIIFHRFRQIDNSSTRKYSGTGLGLSISRELINLLGGKIWVESEEGKGSTFHVEIPFDQIDAG